MRARDKHKFGLFFVCIVLNVLLVFSFCFFSVSKHICAELALPANYVAFKNLSLIATKFKTSNWTPNWTPICVNYISLYSAFLHKTNLTIIAIIDQHISHSIPMVCVFAHSRRTNRNIVHKSYARLSILPENYAEKFKYSSVKVSCSLPPELLPLSDSVKVSFLGLNDCDNWLQIERISADYDEHWMSKHSSVSNITACVRPLFGPYSGVSAILEFVAYYRVNGINKFIFYDLQTSDSVLRLLYSMKRFVEVLPFNLTVNSSEIHASGQMAAINDCLYRNANTQIIIVDIDEFIVPQKCATISDFVESQLSDTSLSSVSALVINNIFFCHQFQTNSLFPIILSHTIRQTYSWTPADRSKLIILRPLTIETLGIHMVWSSISGYRSVAVEQSEAMLYHYRSCCGLRQEYLNWNHLNLYFYIIDDQLIRDTSMHRFRQQLLAFISNYVIF